LPSLIFVSCSQPLTQHVYTEVLSRDGIIKVAERKPDAPAAASPHATPSAGLALEILRILRELYAGYSDNDLYDYWTRVFAWFTGKIVEVTDDVRARLGYLDTRWVFLDLFLVFCSDIACRVNKSKKSIAAKLKEEPFFLNRPAENCSFEAMADLSRMISPSRKPLGQLEEKQKMKKIEEIDEAILKLTGSSLECVLLDMLAWKRFEDRRNQFIWKLIHDENAGFFDDLKKHIEVTQVRIFL
jgi:hypothetical protein